MCCSQHNPQYLDLIHQCCSRLDSRLFSEEDEQNSSETKWSRGEVVGIVQQTSDEGKKSFTFLSRCLTLGLLLRLVYVALKFIWKR